MLFKSALLTQASGSVGGITASHNPGGMYFRSRTIPTDPGSPAQVAVRAAVSDLSNRWDNTLTAAQRGNWATYAANVTVTNALGDAIHLSGQMHYIRSNATRHRTGQTIVDAAPVIFNLGSFTAMSITASEAAQQFEVTFTDADDWPQTDDYFAFFFLSRPVLTTINFFKGPFRGVRFLEGDTAVPLVSPLPLGTFFPFVAGQRLFARVIVATADGRLTADQIMQTDAVA